MGKVLVVDDDEALRRLMRLELSDTYEVIDSGEPEQGLALALENEPDAILLDLRMPNYSGYELLEMFTSFSRTQKIPVIIVSGESGGQTKEHCKQLGAAGYFEKPIDFEALRAGLSQIAKTRRLVPRTEVRVRLRIALKLRGSDCHGKKFEERRDDGKRESERVSVCLRGRTRDQFHCGSLHDQLRTGIRGEGEDCSFGLEVCAPSTLRMPVHREDRSLGAAIRSERNALYDQC